MKPAEFSEASDSSSSAGDRKTKFITELEIEILELLTEIALEMDEDYRALGEVFDEDE